MKYSVVIPYPCFVTVEVEADSKEAAEDLAFEDAYVSGYCGNNGTDKLIGVCGSNVSIEAGDTPIESVGFEISITEI